MNAGGRKKRIVGCPPAFPSSGAGDIAMGLMPAGAQNPFTSVDQQTVIGTLKSSGTRDRDVLHAQKETMLAPYKHLKMLAKIGYVVGGLFTIMIFMAWFGIPVLIASWLLWKFQAKQTAAVEAGYAQYVASLQT
jgi:hypothetical protein